MLTHDINSKSTLAFYDIFATGRVVIWLEINLCKHVYIVLELASGLVLVNLCLI